MISPGGETVSHYISPDEIKGTLPLVQVRHADISISSISINHSDEKSQAVCCAERIRTLAGHRTLRADFSSVRGRPIQPGEDARKSVSGCRALGCRWTVYAVHLNLAGETLGAGRRNGKRRVTRRVSRSRGMGKLSSPRSRPPSTPR